MSALEAQPPVGPSGPIRLTRYFAVACAIIMAVAALVLVRAQMVEQRRHLVDFLSQSTLSLNHAFVNSVWPQVNAFIFHAGEMTANEIRAHPKTAEIDSAVMALADGTRVAKIKIYNRAGRTVYSTDPSQIGQDYSTNPRFIAGRDHGSAGLLERRPRFETIWGEIEDSYIYSNYVAVRPGGPFGPVEAVVEIYQDVTDLRGLQRATLMTGTTGIGLACAAVFGLLVFVVWRAEQALRRQQQRALELAAGIARAEAASRAKSEFLANMSHELRTPLNAVIGFADMMRKESMGAIGNPVYRDYAEDIHASGQHLLEVINDVLDLAKVEAGHIELNVAPTDIGEILETTARMIAPRAERGRVQLALHVAPGLGRLPTDARRLQQIMLNLAGNAVKFTPEGGRVALTARFDETGRGAVIEVSDTGIGMREEDLPVALSPFGQVESSAARRYEGTGLGLPLARKLTEALGGAFAIESAPGKGTRVTMTLPLGAESTAGTRTGRAAA